MEIKNITVFCGSSSGNKSTFEKQAQMLGKHLAVQNIGVVYGGAKIGLMGALAQGAKQANGKVIGVLPEFLRKKEVAHEELDELIIVKDMHERKMKMHDLADGFIALPGGFGTLEELFEMLTWSQLARHQKPIGILNTNGYYNELLSFIRKMNTSGFLRKENFKLFLVSESIDELLEKMKKYEAPELPRWLKT